MGKMGEWTDARRKERLDGRNRWVATQQKKHRIGQLRPGTHKLIFIQLKY